jgi:C4-dicarboxylate-specific signal transduction histidine kinase
MNDNKKISSISIVKSGDKLVVELDDGDGILYEITEDLINPFRMIKTVSQNEIEKFQNLTK